MANEATDMLQLTDSDLIHQTEAMVRDERACTIQILHHLNEIARRKLHLDLGYGSLFDYCVRKLKYSPSAAGRRIAAARCIRRFPETLRLLEDREVSLSTLSLIEPILNEENAASVFARVRRASHREVERVVCEFRPPVALRDRIRPVRVATTAPVEMDALLFERECARVAPEVWRERRPRIESKMLVQFLASEELVEKFEHAKALFSTRSADVSFADVLDVLVTEFLARRDPVARHNKRAAKKGVGTPDSRRREWKGKSSRHVPVAVRDEVYARDHGQCTYVAHDGTRCESRKGLEIDHVKPFAARGNHDAANLRLLCGAHNLRAAEQILGSEVTTRYWSRE